jgi:DNA repair exonuclease SbcCD ATPase subunit
MYLVYDEDKYWVLELASGMEKFISSLAIRIALTNISQLPRPNFLIIDEGWGSLDAENLNSVSMLLDYLKTQFEFIILISHVDQIKEVADIMLELKKDDGFSSLRYPI